MKIILTIVAVILIGGGYWFFSAPSASAPAQMEPANKQVPEQNQPATENPAANETTEMESPATHTVIYTDNGVSPTELTIKSGATVVFENKSSRDIWPASAKHPTHEVYPTKGGCIGSTFDACRGLKTGESWSFTFDQAGAWKHHDHLNPRVNGTITVK